MDATCVKDERMDKVRDEIRETIKEAGISQAAAATEAGVGGSALSQFMNGTYKGDNRKIADSMIRWMDFRKRKAATGSALPKAPDWCPSPSANRILSALTYAHAAGDLAVIYGGAGLGKTVTCREYAKKSPNVWLVTMTPATGVVGACLERVALSVGLHISGRAAKVELALMEKLSGTGGLLIIDEAQHLNVRTLEVLRSLHDATGISLALVGNDLVYAQMTGRGVKSATFAQLFSRIGKRVRLAKVGRNDVQSLCAGWGIAEKESVAYAEFIASQPGALRGLTKTLRLAGMIAADRSEAIGLQHIKAAWKDLSGGAA